MTTVPAYHERVTTVAPRLTLAEAGDALDTAMRDSVLRMLDALPQLPEPRMLASDIKRRPVGFRSLGQLLAAAARDRVPAERALAVAEALHGFVQLLFTKDETPMLELWQIETREQGESDVAQGTALQTRAIGDLDNAIQQTLEEIAAKRRLLWRLQAERHAKAGRAA